MTAALQTVSVIIPTFNRATVLPRAIASALSQKNCVVEIIVVDDGSTDNTLQAIEPFRDEIKYLHKENGGVSSARNLGVRSAAGEFVAFLDSDDFFLDENKLGIQANFLKNNADYGMVFTGVKFVDAEGRDLPGWVMGKVGEMRYPSLVSLRNNVIYTPSVMVKKDVFLRVGGFDEEMKVCEDIDLWRRISREAKIKHLDSAMVAVSIRTGEKYDVFKGLAARHNLYRKMIIEDKNVPSGFIVRLYCELLYKMSRIGLSQFLSWTSKQLGKPLAKCRTVIILALS